MRHEKAGAKQDRDALRRELLAAGQPVEVVAAELTRRWDFRPRAAFRHAHGWSQDELAARCTAVGQRLDIGDHRCPDPAPIVGSRIGEYERWPHGGRRPSVYVLIVLAAALSTSVDRLLDADDLRALPSRDLAVLEALTRTAENAGHRRQLPQHARRAAG